MKLVGRVVVLFVPAGEGSAIRYGLQPLSHGVPDAANRQPTARWAGISA